MEPPTSSTVPPPSTSAGESGTSSRAGKPSGLGYLFGMLSLIGFLYAAPFLTGFENFLGWIILAVGLYVAWNTNRPEDRELRGPFAVGGASPSVPAPPPATPA